MAGQDGDSAVTDASGNTIVDALLWDRHWANRNLTFQIHANATGYGYGASGFGALLPQQNTAVREVLASYSAVSNLTFQEVTTGDARFRFARADATDRSLNGRFEATENVGTAYAIPPDPDSYNRREWGDMWFNDNPAGGVNDMTNPLKGNYGYHTIIHELGHALGMDHPHGDAGIGNNFGNLPSNWDSMEFSVMTYRSFVGDSTANGYNNEDNGFAQSLMAVDIAAMQHVYGANYNTNATDTVYKWRPTTGNMEVNGVAENAATAPGDNLIFRTIWDGGGNDTYDFSSYATNLSVDLRPGTSDDPNVGWTTTSTAQLAQLGTDAAGRAIDARGNIANAWLVLDDAGFPNYLRPLIENAVGGTGNDTIRGNVTNNRLDGGLGNDTLYGGAGVDTLVAGGGVNRLFGEQDRDYLVSGSGADELDGGEGFDYAEYSASTSRVYVDLSIGKTLYGFAQDDTLVGIEGLIGSRYNDSLSGSDSQNFLFGGSGNDTLQGYGGDDGLRGEDGSDILIGGVGADNLDGGIGFDTASYEGSASVTIDVAARSYGGAAFGDSFTSIERVAGSSVADSIAGSTISESFAGRGGADALYGRGGSDTLEGGAGGDTIDGGEGSDWVSYAGSAAGVYVDFSFQGGKVLYGDASGDTLVSVENIEGSEYQDTLVGGAVGDQIWGQGGTDRISGNGANDTLAGHAGNDTIVGGAGADYMDGGDGSDWAEYTDSTAGVTIDISAGKVAGIGGTAEGDALVDFENIRGSTYSDRITGSAASNWLIGQDGNDTLFGLGANDTLDGSAGEDSLDGGTGDDLVQIVASFGDRVSGGGGVDRLVLTRAAGAANWSFDYGTGRGSDGFQASGFSRIDVYGGAASETITGGATADVINGGAGIDRLLGGLQNDTLEGGADADTIDGGGGIDLADYAGAPAGVTVNLSTGVHTGVAVGDTLIDIENLGGSAYADIFTGNAAANSLLGRNGDDRLVGGGGADTLDGGDGNDAVDYAASGSGIVVNLATGRGTGGAAQADVLINVERLIGSAFNDQLTGNGVANVLSGGFGQDTMTGGADADAYYVDNVGDRVLESVGGGSDRAFTSVSYTLAAGQEIERLDTASELGTGAIDLTGNGFANTLVGNAGVNRLDGGAGADVLRGGLGNDTYVVDNAGDRVFELISQGADLVLSSVSFNLGGQYIENLTLTGTGAASATGNSLANILVGNASANTLSGGIGDDVLNGAGGNDLLNGGAGRDTFSFTTPTGTGNVDRIADFLAVDDSLRLASGVFTTLTTGALSATAFKDLSTGAADAGDRILYDKATGGLSYDADGSGTAFAAVRFAILDNKAAITHLDVLVV